MILSRYIILSVIKGFFLIGLILILLFSLILLIEELDEVGTGNYSLLIALQYVVFHMPQILLDFASVISLIGAIIALGSMVNHNELVAVTSLGGQPKHIVLAVISASIVLMIFVLAVSQFVTPYAIQQAKVVRTLALNEQTNLVDSDGYWAQQNNHFIHVKETRYGRIPVNVEIFEFNELQQLKQYLLASEVEIISDDKWLLKDVRVKKFNESEFTEQKLDQMEWRSFLDAKQLGIIISEPDALSLTDLDKYIAGLESRGEQAYQYKLLYWQKLMIPVSAMIMILLGLVFVFGSQRVMSASKRVILGILAGISFYIYSQVITHYGVAQKWQPTLIAMLPSVTIIMVIVCGFFVKFKQVVTYQIQ